MDLENLRSIKIQVVFVNLFCMAFFAVQLFDYVIPRDGIHQAPWIVNVLVAIAFVVSSIFGLIIYLEEK